MWYLVCILIGFAGGYILKDLISPETVFKGKVRQKGENNRIVIKREEKGKERRLKRKDRDK